MDIHPYLGFWVSCGFQIFDQSFKSGLLLLYGSIMSQPIYNQSMIFILYDYSMKYEKQNQEEVEVETTINDD